MPKPAAIVMLGDGGSTPQEQLVTAAQRAATIDLIFLLKTVGISPVILCAPDLNWWPDDLHVWLAPDPADRPFHFGTYLAEAIIANRLDHVLYFGGASAPLLDLSMLRLLMELLNRAHHQRLAICNNLHSSDWVALTAAQESLAVIKAAHRDNSLAWMLREDGGYEIRVLTEIRQSTAFDLDTPSDLAMIRYHPECGLYLQRALANPLLDAVPVQQVLNILSRTGSHIALIGRVSPKAWQALNAVTQSWVRVFSEERGMVANERAERGEVKSLLGKLIELQGIAGFFNTLSNMVEAAIIDSRILMAHFDLKPSDADRFASDLFMVDAISDPWLRDFTAAAAAAPIPIILGGHSAVAGGLYLLSEILELRKATPH
jgi:hypothetical protein